MIGENGLHHLRGDLTPAAFNQVPQALQPRAGIGRGVSLVRGELRGEVVVGVQPAVRALIPVHGDPLGPDLDVGDSAAGVRSEENTAELQSHRKHVLPRLLGKKKKAT